MQLKKPKFWDKKKSNFVAVLVKPDEDILEKIKHLPFDYYQIYDCTPEAYKVVPNYFTMCLKTMSPTTYCTNKPLKKLLITGWNGDV